MCNSRSPWFAFLHYSYLLHLLFNADELRGHEWHIRFQIIRGISEGLHYLHKKKGIIHMDLKPPNILLDDDMEPKITDFGISRLDGKSQTMSTERLCTL